jgi:hypothetical protein
MRWSPASDLLYAFSVEERFSGVGSERKQSARVDVRWFAETRARTRATIDQ